jgi:hypothetical protein
LNVTFSSLSIHAGCNAGRAAALPEIANACFRSVRDIKAEVSWITRTEKDRLNKAKRRNMNDDPAQLYLYFNARIVLCDELPGP